MFSKGSEQSFLFTLEENMDNLNFYTVDQKYVKYLQNAEIEHRGFSRVPNMDYGKYRKQKFTPDKKLSGAFY